MRILITGGAGYIGSHVIKQFIENTDFDVFVIDNLSTGLTKTIDTLKEIHQKSQKPGKLEFFHEELDNFQKIEEIFKQNQFDSIIHFAASIIVPESVENPLKYYMNNTVNTTNIINLCVKYNVSRFIFSSTAAVYGEPEKVPVNENAFLNPINPYGMSKLMSEHVIKDSGIAYNNFKYIILRYFNVAGADLQNRIGHSFPKATHLLKVASETATGKRDKMYIFGDDYNTKDGTCIRDYIHVEDLADSHIKALEYLNNGKSDIFNCGYGYGYSVKEVIDMMKEVSGVNFTVEKSERRPGDPATLIADTQRIRDIMGWSPRYNDLALICKTALEWEKKI